MGERIRASMPPGAVFAGGEISAAASPLFPEEEAAVRNAVPKRRAEFRAGRAYARAALAELGVAATAIAAGKDRAPVWPVTITASITHDDTYCGVMAARTSDFSSVGIDIESAAPLGELSPYVCSAAELEQCAQLGDTVAADVAKLIFCAKESAYKAYYALARVVLEFADVEIRLSPSDETFTASIRAGALPMPNFGRTIQGRFLALGSHVVTWTAIPDLAG